MKLWTVIRNPETLEVVDAFDQAVPSCGMGPNTCGGCRDCVVAQCGDDWLISYDIPDEKLKEMTKEK